MLKKAAGQAISDIGFSAGVNLYQGDLTSSRIGSYKTVRPMIGFIAGKSLSNAISTRLSLSIGGLRGDDTKYKPEYRQYRAFKFTSQLAELTGAGVFTLFPKQKNRILKPYLFAGVSLVFFHTKTDYSRFIPSYFSAGENLPVRLQQDIAIKPVRSILMIPTGMGVRYSLNSTMVIFSELKTRLSQNDFIDGYSLSVNPQKNDTYSTFSIGISYQLSSMGQYIPCPKLH